MQRIIITGNLTADPELRATNSGKDVCNFTVAVNRTIGDGTDYFRITAWNGTAANCGKYLKKGRKVAVIGTVSCSAFVNKNGDPRANLELNAMEVEFLSSAKQEKAEDCDFGSMKDYNDDLPWE